MSSSVLTAQNKNQLKKKKSKLHKEIKKMNGLLSEINRDKKGAEITYLINVMKIEVREELIESINEEIREVDLELAAQNTTIDSLNNQLLKFQDQYKKMLVYAYKNRNATNSIIFIFSSNDFNQAYKRLKYIKKIGEYREHQAIEVASIKKAVEVEITRLENKKEKKKRILGDKYYEKNKLQKEKTENKEVLQGLKKDEKNLKKEILKKQKEATKLDSEIKKIIEKEIALARERAQKERERLKKGEGKKGKNDPSFGLTPIAEKLSKRFEQNKGILPWPVKSGKISAKYGISKHPAFEHIKVTNNGVNIITNKGSHAMAIFGGNVVAVIVLPSGGKSAVLMQHGAYFTLYSNLITVKVKKGQEIKLGQKLGIIKTEENGKTEIHFELWKGNAKQNPALWLKK
jgi:septal ring factor EnvC (AmiA/AmiB activator)